MYLTYLIHPLKPLKMTRSEADPCVILRKKNHTLKGLLLLQVDDSLEFGTENFTDEEKAASKVFQCNPRTVLPDAQTTFNGIDIRRSSPRSPLGLSRTHIDRIDKIEEAATPNQFKSQRSLRQYIGVNLRPDICASIQIIAPLNIPPSGE